MEKRSVRILMLGLSFMAVFFSCNVKKTIVRNDSAKELNYIPYYLKIYKADSLYLTDNFKESYIILDSLFKVYPPLNSDNYAEYGVYLNSAVMSGNLEDIDEKVRFGYLKFGNIRTLHRRSREMCLAVNKAANLNDEEIKELKLKYYNSLDLDLRKKMLQMYNDDQAVRLEKKSREEVGLVDENNRKELNRIFKIYGFPKKSLIGSNNAYDIPDGGSIYLYAFFVHQPDSVRTKFLPILLEGVKKGYCEPDIYSFVYDRTILDKSKKQYYGTFNCGESKLCDLINPEKLDALRRSIGLPHIGYEIWRTEKFQSN